MTYNERSPQTRSACRSLMGVRIIGTGSYVPEAVVTNDQLHERLGCDSDWIIKRTGILERRHALPHQATSDLCHEAGRRCLAKSDVNPKDIDLLVLATFTSDMTFPSTACLVQDRLKLTCPALEVQSACAGFMYALVTGAAYVLSGASDLALIIGGDCNTRVVNPKDIKTWPLFGDGAGAVLLTRGEADQGLVSYCLGSDGSGADILNRPACGSRLPPTSALLDQGLHFMHMDGRAVFRWAVSILCDTIQDVLKAGGFRPNDIDLYFPHQANIRIINAAVDVLKIPRSKVCRNLEYYGNTSAASIPLGIDEALAQDQIKRGNLLLLSGFGAGLAWGTGVWRW
jgi:3-oxoacyl-[acyl-carrier-protein] synthase III